MRTTIHIYTSDKGIDDMIQEVLREVRDERTLIYLSEHDNYKEYVGYNRNIQVGRSSEELDIEKILSYKNVIVESYDYDDFISFMSQRDILGAFMESTGKNMYIIVPKNVKVDIGKKFDMEQDTLRGENHEFLRTKIKLKNI